MSSNNDIFDPILKSLAPRLWSDDGLKHSIDTKAYDNFHCDDDAEQPEDIFAATEELRTHLNSTPPYSPKENVVFEALCRIVHGSNLIEGAGTSPVCTTGLWRSSLGRQNPEDLSQKHIVYRWLKLEQHRRDWSDDDTTIQKIYREVVQHLRALMFLLDEIVLQDKPFSEELIPEAHKILTYKVDSAADSHNVYGGVYRTTDVCAGLTTFTAPEHVPREMRAFIRALSSEISAAEQVGHIDPYVLAAKYCHKFINIHPFVDGNGRICLLILNILLFKYAGVFCVLGENEQAKDEYLSIAVRGSRSDQTWKESDEEEAASMKPPWGELALLILRQSRKGMQEVLQHEAWLRNPPRCTHNARNAQAGQEVSESSSEQDR
ncbi:Fic-domain-containing protein, partial [Aureobasidium melanogenum]